MNFIRFCTSEQCDEMKQYNAYSELYNGQVVIFSNPDCSGLILIRCSDIDYLNIQHYAVCHYPQSVFLSCEDGTVKVDNDVLDTIKDDINNYKQDLLEIIHNTKIINDTYISNVLIRNIELILQEYAVSGNNDFQLFYRDCNFSLSVKENEDKTYGVYVGEERLYTLSNESAARTILKIIQKDFVNVIKYRYPKQKQNFYDDL